MKRSALPVRPRRVGPGPQVQDQQVLEEAPKLRRHVAAPIVGHHPLDHDPLPRIPRHRPRQEGRAGGGRLVAQHFGIGDPRHALTDCRTLAPAGHIPGEYPSDAAFSPDGLLLALGYWEHGVVLPVMDLASWFGNDTPSSEVRPV
jgi:hypothetical protein